MILGAHYLVCFTGSLQLSRNVRAKYCREDKPTIIPFAANRVHVASSDTVCSVVDK